MHDGLPIGKQGLGGMAQSAAIDLGPDTLGGSMIRFTVQVLPTPATPGNMAPPLL